LAPELLLNRSKEAQTTPAEAALSGTVKRAGGETGATPMKLESLALTEEELKIARDQVQQMAFRKWQEAGCPSTDPVCFWKDAELEWIEYYYVPDRNLVES
jgi:hypothetical protein